MVSWVGVDSRDKGGDQGSEVEESDEEGWGSESPAWAVSFGSERPPLPRHRFTPEASRVTSLDTSSGAAGGNIGLFHCKPGLISRLFCSMGIGTCALNLGLTAVIFLAENMSKSALKNKKKRDAKKAKAAAEVSGAVSAVFALHIEPRKWEKPMWLKIGISAKTWFTPLLCWPAGRSAAAAGGRLLRAGAVTTGGAAATGVRRQRNGQEDQEPQKGNSSLSHPHTRTCIHARFSTRTYIIYMRILCACNFCAQARAHLGSKVRFSKSKPKIVCHFRARDTDVGRTEGADSCCCCYRNCSRWRNSRSSRRPASSSNSTR